eukprot:3031637-Amphidinium_carterae.2
MQDVDRVKEVQALLCVAWRVSRACFRPRVFAPNLGQAPCHPEGSQRMFKDVGVDCLKNNPVLST